MIESRVELKESRHSVSAIQLYSFILFNNKVNFVWIWIFCPKLSRTIPSTNGSIELEQLRNAPREILFLTHYLYTDKKILPKIDRKSSRHFLEIRHWTFAPVVYNTLSLGMFCFLKYFTIPVVGSSRTRQPTLAPGVKSTSPSRKFGFTSILRFLHSFPRPHDIRYVHHVYKIYFLCGSLVLRIL